MANSPSTNVPEIKADKPKIVFTDPEIPSIEEISARVDAWLSSPERAMMLTSDRYFRVRNDILDRKMELVHNGKTTELKNVANNRIAHGFYRKLVRQKVNYLLGAPLSLSSENSELQDAVNEYKGEDFDIILKNTARETITKGIAWWQVYYTGTADFRYKRIPAEQIAATWMDVDHTILDSIIRVYDIVEYKSGEPVNVRKVEYHNRKGVIYLEKRDGDYQIDTSITDPKYIGMYSPPFEQIEVDPNTGDVMVVKEMYWDNLPFIPFKYTPDEEPLLVYIKSLLDTYDLRQSDVSNSIEDIPNGVKVIKNYDGANIDELVQNLVTSRVIKVRADGDVNVLSVQLDSVSTEAHLTRLRKDLYESGGGVDTQADTLGNSSGVSLRFRYADLDLDCKDLSSEIQISLSRFFWFVKADIKQRTGREYPETVTAVFNTDGIVNDIETVQIINQSYGAGVLSKKTAVANHPYVTDVNTELEQMEKEEAAKEEMYDLALGIADNTDSTTNPDEGEAGNE